MSSICGVAWARYTSFEGVSYRVAVPSLDDLRRQLRALGVAGLPLEELWRRSDAALRRVVPWDYSAWGQVDPATLLSTGCLVLGLPFDPGREADVFALEHDEGEVNRLIDLVHRTPPAGGCGWTRRAIQDAALGSGGCLNHSACVTTCG